MFFEESDNRNPRERVDDNILRQLISDNNGDGYRYQTKRTGPTRNARSVAAGSGNIIGCACGVGGVGGTAVDKIRDNENIIPDACRRTWGLTNYPLGSVFTPIQEWRGLYDLDTGFCRGTIFRELDLPFLASAGTGGRGGCCRG